MEVKITLKCEERSVIKLLLEDDAICEEGYIYVSLLNNEDEEIDWVCVKIEDLRLALRKIGSK